MKASEILPYGDRALLVQLRDTRAVVAWHQEVRRRGLAGVADLVPAAETLLVVSAEGADLGSLHAELADLDVEVAPGDEETDDLGDVLEIAVTYDGPDLEEVARLTGLSQEEVVSAHTGTTWRVAFGGFAPGFGYLVTDDDRLEVPRREEARTAVPTGAVGLAGRFSGVYPRESPGGWQLIGRTDEPMWDLEREPPALLSPGGRVRFEVASR